MHVVHIAIPTHDIDKAITFYQKYCKAVPARRYDDRITFKFFEHQLVCHLDPEGCFKEPQFYPRHFGITFTDKEAYFEFHEHCESYEAPFFQKPTVRWPDKPEHHYTFSLVDPSNNILEFKYYEEKKFVY